MSEYLVSQLGNRNVQILKVIVCTKLHVQCTWQNVSLHQPNMVAYYNWLKGRLVCRTFWQLMIIMNAWSLVNLYSTCILTLRFSLSLFLGKYLEAQKHYYYPGLREQFRFPPAKREIAEELPLMTEIEQEERTSVKDRMSKESGFVGVSLLHRLHKLYKFDIIKDLVFDVMHLVPLNLVKRRFEHLLSNSLLDPEQLQLALEKVPWTQGILKSCLAMSSIN